MAVRPRGRPWRLAAVLALAATTAAAQPAASPDPAPLSFIVLLADDLRWDPRSAPAELRALTPELQRLAAEGVLFANAFCTTSICPSSRASFLTGRWTASHGIDGFGTPLSADALAGSWPVVLRRRGYRAAFVGKWGLGGALPVDAFDDWRGFAGQGRYTVSDDGETAPTDAAGASDYLGGGSRLHLTRRLAEAAVEILGAVDRRHPFLLQLSFKAPHVQDRADNLYPYDPVFAPLVERLLFTRPAGAGGATFVDLPAFLRTSEGRARWRRRFASEADYQRSMRGYWGLVAGIDAAVGRIREALDERGLAASTAIVVSSDNGILLGEHGLAGKWLAYEPSIRIPLVIYLPDLPAGRRGAVVEEMALNVDLAPTLLELAGVPVPAAVEGRSLVPLVCGEPVAWRADWLYEHRLRHPRIPESEGVRGERFKYVRYPRQGFEQLFDLERDPLELDNLAARPEQAARLEALRQRLEELKEPAARRQPAGVAPPPTAASPPPRPAGGCPASARAPGSAAGR